MASDKKFTITPISKENANNYTSTTPANSLGGFTITPIGQSSGEGFQNYLNNYNNYIRNRQTFANRWNQNIAQSSGKKLNTGAPAFSRYTSTATNQIGRQAQPLWGYAKSHKQEFLDQGYTEDEYNKMLASLNTSDLNQFKDAASYMSQYYNSQLRDAGINPNSNIGKNNFLGAMQTVDESLANADKSVSVNTENYAPSITEINDLESAYKRAEQKENDAYQAIAYASDPWAEADARKAYEAAQAETEAAKKAWTDAQTSYDNSQKESKTTSGSYDVAKQYTDRAAKLSKGGEYEEDVDLDELMRQRDEARASGNSTLEYELTAKINNLQEELDTRWNKDYAQSRAAAAYASAYQWDDYIAAAQMDPALSQEGLLKSEEDLQAYLDNADSVFDTNEVNKMKHEHPTEEWTDDQKQAFGWMYLNDPQKAAEYATQINAGLDAAKRAEEERSMLTEDDGTNKKLGALDWLKARYYDLGAIGDFLVNAYEYLDVGTITSKDYLSPSQRAQIIDTAIAQNLNENHKTLPEDWAIIGGKGWGDAYQIGNSILMSTIAGLSTGGGWLGSLSSGAMFFGPAASNAYYQAVEQGATPGQAIVFGLASGTFEMLFEEVSLDKVKELSKLTVNTPSKNIAEGVLKWARSVGISAFIEGDEEINTSIANWIGEAIILQENSKSQQQIQYIMANEGLDYDQAWLKVFKQNCEDIAYDGVVGAISGAIHTGAYSAVENAYNATAYDNSALETGTRGVTINEELNLPEGVERPAGRFQAANAQELIDIASQYGDSDLAAKTQAAMQRRIDKGKTATISKGQAKQLAASITPETYTKASTVAKNVDQAAKMVDESARNKANVKAETKDIALDIAGKKYTIEDIGYGNKREVRLKDAEGKTESKSIDEVFDQLPEETQALITWADNILGDNAAGAVYMYDGSQTIGEYVAAMNAATAVAAGGAKVEAAGNPLISTLNRHQLEVAQLIGEEMHKAELADTEKRVQTYDAAKAAAEQAIQTADVKAAAENIQTLESTLKSVQENHAASVAAMDNYEPGTEEYAEAKQKVIDLNTEAKQIQTTIDQSKADLETLKQKVRFTARKKGTVSFGGGMLDGVQQKAVTGPLAKNQQAVVDMVNSLADVFNFDYVFYDGDSHTGGAYVNGSNGKIFININSGRFAKKYLAASTLSHELTHAMQEYAGDKYEELKQYVVDQVINKRGAGTLNRLVQKEIATGVSADKALDEVVANACSEMLMNSATVRQLAQENSSLFEEVRSRIGDIMEKIQAAFSDKTNTLEAAIIAREFEDLQKIWDDAAAAMVENKTNLEIAGMSGSESGETQFMIMENMTEDERYEELKNSNIRVIADTRSEDYSDDLSALQLVANAKSKAEKIIIPLAKKLGIINKKMSTPEVDVDFLFTKSGGLSESLSKQFRYGGDYIDFAKALINIEDILNNAKLIEAHSDKYKGTKRENPNLINTSVLLGAFTDGETIIPVQFEIKNTSDNGGRLYLTVALTKIKADVLESASGKNASTPSLVSAEYSLPDIVKEINPQDKHFLKYIPYQMLTDAQKAAKNEALEEDANRINAYEKKESSAKKEKATEVDEATLKEEQNAIIQKYHPREDWNIQTWINSADDIKTFAEATADAEDGVTPDYTKEMIDEALRTGYITVYSSNKIRQGTFVTPSKMIAQDYAGEGKVNSKRVRLTDVAWIDEEQGQYANIDQERSQKTEQFQRVALPDQISLDDWMKEDVISHSDVNPEIRKRLDDAAALEAKVKKYFDYVDTDSEYFLSPDEIDSMMEVDPYATDGDMENAEQIVMNLSNLSKEQTGKKLEQTYMLMDELLPHLSNLQAENWTEEHWSQNQEFTQWYNNRHPSLYYPGYTPGHMDRRKEIAYLQEMLQRDDLLEQDRKDMQDQLDRLLENREATFYQRWAESEDQTSMELADNNIAQNRLQVENNELKNIVNDLNKQIKELMADAKKSGKKIDDLKRQMKATDVPEVREADARRMASQLVRSYHSNVSVDEIAADIKALGDYLVQHTGEELDYAKLYDMAETIADKVVSEAYGLLEDVTGEKQIYKEIADMIKGRKFWLPENMRGELDVLDGYNAFRKKNFSRFYLGEGGQSIDSFYEEMQDTFGKHYFPDVNTQGEMLIVMSDIFDQARDEYGNPFAQDQDLITRELANDILGDAISENLRQMAPTLADKQQAKIKALQAKNKARMDALRQQKNERIADVYRKGVAMREQAIARERTKRYDQVKALKEHYQAKEQRASERRGNSKVRQKIRKLVNELNARLKNPNSKKYVPVEFMQQTIDLLNMINMDTGRSANLTAELGKLRNMYDSYKNNPTYSVAYSDEVSNTLKELAQKIGDTPLSKMTADQLDAVYNTLKSLDYQIRDAVKVRFREEEYNAYQLSSDMTKETRSVPKAQSNAFTKWLTAHLRADVMFKRLGGFAKDSTWEMMADMLNDGQLKQTMIQMRLTQPFMELINDERAIRHFTATTLFGNIDQKDLVDIGLIDKDGNPIKITHDMMVGIYLDLLNEDNARHFLYGGKTIPDLQKFYTGKGGFDIGSRRSVGIAEQLSNLRHELAEANRMGEADRAKQIRDQIELTTAKGDMYVQGVKENIEKNLTAFDKKWIQATQQLMDMDSKRYLNETTMDVYGIERFQVPNYFPIFTDKNFTNTDFESITKDYNLENAGFTKERVKASNPTYANGVVDVVNKQINRVAQYSGLMPAIKNFKKVYNKTGAGYSDSLKDALKDKFGLEGQKYVENLLADLVGSRKEEGNALTKILGKLRGNLAQTSLTLNPRVSLSQAASYPTAAAVLGWRPLAKALAKGGKNGRMISRADQELIAKYSPLLWYRMQGYTDAELGDIKNSNDLASKVWKKARWATGWIQAVDGAVVGRLWNAAEYWVQENTKGLKVGTDEYYQEVAKKFNEVIEKTQPNYTTMQKAAIIRDPSSMMKMFTMFMTQRLQNFNILYNSVAQYQRMRADKANGRNGVTAKDVQTSRNDMIRAISSQMAQAATYTAFKLLADALLHGMDKYRDKDDDELTAKSISLQLLNNYIDALVGSFILGSELYSVIKSMAGIDKWYGFALNGVDTISDLVSDLISTVNTWKDFDPEDEKSVQKMQQALMKFAKSGSQAGGIPLNNALKIGNALINHVQDALNGEFLSFNAGHELDKDAVGIRMVEALQSGDKEKFDKYADTYSSTNSMYSAIENKVKAGYLAKKQTISKKEAVDLLVEAGEPKRTAEKKVQQWTCELVTGIPYDKIDDQFVADKISEDRAAELYVTYGGMTKADAKSYVQQIKCEKVTGVKYSNIKSEYIAGNLTDAQVKSMLKTYGGKDESTASKTVLKYSFEKDTEYSWDDKAEALYAGAVSDSKLAGYLQKISPTTYGTKEKADNYVRYLHFQHDYPRYADLSESNVRDIYEAKAATSLTMPQAIEYQIGISKCKGTDKDGDGKTDTNSLRDAKIKYILLLPYDYNTKLALFKLNYTSKQALDAFKKASGK